MFEALVAQPCGYVEGALSVMAEDGDVFLGIKFLVGARGDIAHGHEGAGFDVGGGVFPGLADIDEAGLVFAEKGGCVGGRDFVFEHEIQCRTWGILRGNCGSFDSLRSLKMTDTLGDESKTG